MKGRPYFILWLILIGIAVFVLRNAMSRPHSSGIIPWRSDFESARQAAIDAHKPLFVDFRASWCGPCQEMDETTWSDQKVAAALGDYVPVSVDVDSDPAIAQRYQINNLPAVVIIDPATGNIGRGLVGAANPREFLEWLGGKSLPAL
jgi:thiol:disulfide interchange protein